MTLKVERSVVDIQFVCHMRDHSRVRNLSLRESSLGNFGVFLPPPSFGYLPQPHPFPPRNPGQFLKVLDLSDMNMHVMMLLRNWVLDEVESQVTHLYLENCPLIPRRVPAHLKVEILSVAGYQPFSGESFGEYAFRDVNGWATIPSIREINASGCEMTKDHREKLITTHPNVKFNLSEQFSASARVKL